MIDSPTLVSKTPSQASQSDNVRKCLVLSGPFNAPPVFNINLLYQHDLQQFPSCSRPDIPDIRPASAGIFHLRSDKELPPLPDPLCSERPDVNRTVE